MKGKIFGCGFTEGNPRVGFLSTPLVLRWGQMVSLYVWWLNWRFNLRVVFDLVWKSNWFWISMLHDLVELAPILYAIAEVSRAIPSGLGQIYWITCVLCDWVGWSLWFSFPTLKLKTGPRLLHTSRFFVGRQKIFTCWLACGEFRQVCHKRGLSGDIWQW